MNAVTLTFLVLFGMFIACSVFGVRPSPQPRMSTEEEARQAQQEIRRINRQARAEMLRLAMQRSSGGNGWATASPNGPSSGRTNGRAKASRPYFPADVIDGEVVD